MQEIRAITQEELIDALRRKILCEVQGMMHRLNRGYQPDVQFLLSEIYAIDMLSRDALGDLGTYALQYYLNNSWEPY